MTTNRLEAFSDGVLAIIITIMVLELKVPETSNFIGLKILLPKLISYVLSFLYVGIYWNNHHHLFQTIEKVNGKVLWANLFLLFWLSLLPFATGWMGENHFDSQPVMLYGLILMMSAFAFLLLEKTSILLEGKSSKISIALSSKRKEIISVIIYMAGIILASFVPKISIGLYYVVALLWVIPDQRFEKVLNENT
ncbi:protein of unknown function DUF1211 [Pseudopedobacter saltans DSM 12145]|uniref:DUF1211 domain-containing protein n=1 Tax=Pseudopedobacter saltans (strain ATCC 51119 / DSM 12145 / JCM 21818 / CCUG 39354 / LMG 10337 / NBRC 100064 / NCIMB 13643) TaxID=762903 RepID=F0SB07_PSESL|nr:TMEM175 family protein [Pseudopedobacter saltans]ADY52642.1 protein of unknown function DUF1211 [Pseudopedobacter saltans DSM 12145]